MLNHIIHVTDIRQHTEGNKMQIFVGWFCRWIFFPLGCLYLNCWPAECHLLKWTIPVLWCVKVDAQVSLLRYFLNSAVFLSIAYQFGIYVFRWKMSLQDQQRDDIWSTPLVCITLLMKRAFSFPLVFRKCSAIPLVFWTFWVCAGVRSQETDPQLQVLWTWSPRLSSATFVTSWA